MSETGGLPGDGRNDAAALHDPAPQPPVKPRRALGFPIPLGQKFLAHIIVPEDMSRAEMLKLRRVLWTLAVPWSKP